MRIVNRYIKSGQPADVIEQIKVNGRIYFFHWLKRSQPKPTKTTIALFKIKWKKP